MHARAHNFGIQQVQRDQVQHGHRHHHAHVDRDGVDSQRGEQRRKRGHRQTHVRHQAQEAAQRSHQQGVGQAHGPEDHRAQRGQQQSQQEVPYHEGAHHDRDSLHAARGNQPVFAVKQLQEAAVDVVAPAQHEVHQERNEGSHQQDPVERAPVRLDVVANGRALLVNPHLRNDAGAGGLRGRRRGPFLRSPSLGLQRAQPLLLLLLALPGGNQHAVGLLFQPRNLLLDAVDQIADALAVLGQVVVQAGELRVGAQPGHVKKQQCHGAHQEARQAPGKTQAHEQPDERLQKKRDGDGDNGRDEKHAPKVENRNNRAHRHNRRSQAPRFLRGLGCAVERFCDQRHGARRPCLECSTPPSIMKLT